MFTLAKELLSACNCCSGLVPLGKGSEHTCKFCPEELKIKGYKKINESKGDWLSKKPEMVKESG